MKRFSSICMIALVLTACAHQHEGKEVQVDYVCPLDTNFTVVFSADGETATLYDEADRVFTLQNSPAASGAYYKNDSGVSIHTKKDDAIVELVKDKPIQCQVWKGR